MKQYACWFCGETIDRGDKGAVMIVVENLWQWDAGIAVEDRSLFQSVYAHSACTKSRLKGATMELEPHIFLEDEED